MRQMDVGKTVVADAPRFAGALDIPSTEGETALPWAADSSADIRCSWPLSFFGRRMPQAGTRIVPAPSTSPSAAKVVVGVLTRHTHAHAICHVTARTARAFSIFRC